MGCYDTVLVPCPKCGELYQAQSKSGSCSMSVFDFDSAPQDVMENVNRHAPFECEKCGTYFSVKTTFGTIAEQEVPFESLDLPERATIGELETLVRKYYSKLDEK